MMMTSSVPPGMDILKDSYAQGGALLFLDVLCVFAVIAAFRWPVRILWHDNKDLREKLFSITERFVTVGAAQKEANETAARALIDLSKEVSTANLKVEESVRTIERLEHIIQNLETRGRR
jgi:hypothetical protein